jgi:hypothetical protein
MDEVTVSFNRGDSLQVLALYAEDADLAMERERDRLILPAEQPQIGSFHGFYNSDLLVPQEELGRYRSEREEYLKKYRAALFEHVVHRALQERDDAVFLTVTNTSDRPLTDVRIRLRLPEDVLPFVDPSDVPSRLPEPPRPPSRTLPMASLLALGHLDRFPYAPSLPSLKRGITVTEDRREIVFTVGSLHALDTLETERFALLALDKRTSADENLHSPRTVSLVLSAGDRSGVMELTLTLGTTGTTWTVESFTGR